MVEQRPSREAEYSKLDYPEETGRLDMVSNREPLAIHEKKNDESGVARLSLQGHANYWQG